MFKLRRTADKTATWNWVYIWTFNVVPIILKTQHDLYIFRIDSELAARFVRRLIGVCCVLISTTKHSIADLLGYILLQTVIVILSSHLALPPRLFRTEPQS